MVEQRKRIPAGMKRLTVTVPEGVADYYEQRGLSYGVVRVGGGKSVKDFAQQPGADTRPR